METADKAKSSGASCQDISLGQIIHITDTLAGLVQDMLGPTGQQTLLSTHTGKALVTRDGMTILSSLHVGHPVARCIVQSVQSYYSAYSDGSKTFLLYLSEALRAVRDHINKEGQSACSQLRLALELSQYLNTDFEKIMGQVLQMVKPNLSLRDCLEVVVFSAVRVLRTSLQTCVQKQLVAFFTGILSHCLSLNCPRLDQLEHRSAHFLQNFNMYHTKVPTQPHQKSRICDGVLLETDMSVCQNQTDTKSEKFFALMDIDFDGEGKGKNSISVHLMSEKIEDMLLYKRNSLQCLLTSLQSVRLEVLLCSEIVPAYVVAMCREKGISVQCIRHEKLVFLSDLTGVPILKDIYQRELKDYLFTAHVSSFVRVGNKVCTLIELSESNCLFSPISHMIVCAPTEGMCDHVCRSLYKAVKALYECLKSSSEDSAGIALPAAGASGTDCLKSVQADVSLKQLSGMDTSDSRNCKNVNSTNKFYFYDCEFPSAYASHQNLMLSVCAGGAFEALIICAITGSVNRQRVDHVIEKMLMSVPRTLHANLARIKHGQQRQFTQAWTSMLSNISQGRQLGLGIHHYNRSEFNSETENEFIEPLGPKLSLVAHVVQLVVQLLRVDAVVPVGKLPVRNSVCGKADHCGESDDDENGER